MCMTPTVVEVQVAWVAFRFARYAPSLEVKSPSSDCQSSSVPSRLVVQSFLGLARKPLSAPRGQGQCESPTHFAQGPAQRRPCQVIVG